MIHTSVNLHAYRHRARSGRPIEAIYYRGLTEHAAALLHWARERDFNAYVEADKVVVKVERRRWEEVVIRPGWWLVFDMGHPRRNCRVQAWEDADFIRNYALDLEEFAA